MKDGTDNLKKEIIIEAGLLIGAIIIESLIVVYLHLRYVGITAGIIGFLVILSFRYLEMKKSFNKFEDEIIKLKVHHELLTAPKGYLEYLFDVFNSLKSPNGYPFHTQQYTEILAKFLITAKQKFISTWTIDIDLGHMSIEFMEQQRRSMKSKRRILFLSKQAMKSQMEKDNKVKEFIEWHKNSGVELYWLNRETLVQDIISQGLTNIQITEVLEQREDFILFDDEEVLFYDTRDEIKEGHVPDPKIFYSVSLISMESLKNSQDLLYQRILKVIENISQTPKAIKIETFDTLKNALEA